MLESSQVSIVGRRKRYVQSSNCSDWSAKDTLEFSPSFCTWFKVYERHIKNQAMMFIWMQTKKEREYTEIQRHTPKFFFSFCMHEKISSFQPVHKSKLRDHCLCFTSPVPMVPKLQKPTFITTIAVYAFQESLHMDIKIYLQYCPGHSRRISAS